MTRQDLLGFERFYATTLRREAKKRAKRYPVVAAWSDPSLGRDEERRLTAQMRWEMDQVDAALDMMGDHAAGIASDPAQNVLPFGRRG